MNTGPSVALTKCFYCGDDDKIILQARNIGVPNKHVQEAHGKVLDMDPCTKCKGYMKQGVILITIDDAKSKPGWNKERMPNPWRTGGFFVVKDGFISEAFQPNDIADWALTQRWMFIEHEAAEKMGLFAAAKQIKTEVAQ